MEIRAISEPLVASEADLAGSALRIDDCKLTGMTINGIEVSALLTVYGKSL